MRMKAHLRLSLSLLAVVIGFGSQWNCTIQIGPPAAPQKPAPKPVAPPPASGCVNQQPTYTLGEEAPLPNEYAIVVGEFKPEKGKEAEAAAAAYQLSAKLREKRVFNSIWKKANGTIMVTVGKYGTRKQAEGKLKAIRDRGFPEACVDQPSSPADFVVPNAECVDCEPVIVKDDSCPECVVVMFLIIVFVVIVIASHAKNKPSDKGKC